MTEKLFALFHCSDIFDGGAEKPKYSFDGAADKPKYSFTENDFGPSTGAIWNPYGIDLNSLTRDSTGSGSSSSFSFDNYNPKFNNNPEDTIFDSYKYGVTDWDTEYSPRQRGTIGSDMFTSSSSNRPKKVASPNSKRAVTKIVAKPKPRAPKRIQPNKEPERDLVPPPPKK